jgi:hypothetical protein
VVRLKAPFGGSTQPLGDKQGVKPMFKMSQMFFAILIVAFSSGCNTGYVRTTAAVLSAAGVREADIISSCTDRRNFDQCMTSTVNYAAERGREENARVAAQAQQQGYDEIYIKNLCSVPVYIEIRYYDINDNWTSNEGIIGSNTIHHVANTKRRDFHTNSMWEKNGEPNWKKKHITTKTWGTWTETFCAS